jgi:hypothetical protein
VETTEIKEKFIEEGSYMQEYYLNTALFFSTISGLAILLIAHYEI